MPADRKAVLAAVLAVQNGHVSPTEAMAILAEVGGAAAAEKTLAMFPAAQREAVARQVESLDADTEKATEMLRSAGLSADATQSLLTTGASVAETLFSIAPKAAPAPAQVPLGPQRYEVLREHARGGMGRVLIALDKSVGREVALKELLPPAPAKGGSPFTPHSDPNQAAARFLREARVTGRLEHPNIVPVYEIGQRPDGSPFYTMKFVKGQSLAHKLESISKSGLGVAEKLRQRLGLLDSFVDACQAVAYAHARGVIHRDIKPGNIMLGDFGETLLLDWGLAKIHGSADIPSSDSGETDAGKTQAGAVMGTPVYMAPEQAEGDTAHVNERSDVYGLGAVLYEIVAGCPPYTGATSREILSRVIKEAPRDAVSVDPLAPKELAAIAARAMARSPSDRFASASELGSQVQAFRDGKMVTAYSYSTSEVLRRFLTRHRTSVIIGLIALLVALALGAWSFARVSQERNDAVLARGEAESERNLALSARKDAESSRADAQREAQLAREAERAAQRSRADAFVRKGDALAEARHWDEARASYEAGLAELRRLDEPVLAAELGLAWSWREGPPSLGALNDHGLASSGCTMRVSEDGQRLAGTGGWDFRVWGARPWRLERVLATGSGRMNFALTRDGSLAAWDDGSEIHVWRVADGERVASLASEMQGTETVLEFSANGDRLYAAGRNLRVLAIGGVAQPRVLAQSKRAYISLDTSAEGILACSDSDGIHWVREDGEVKVCAGKGPASALQCAWAGAGMAALACADGALRIWDVRSDSLLFEVQVSEKALGHISVSPDKLRAATSTIDGRLFAITLSPLAVTKTGPDLGGGVLSLQYLRDGRVFACATGRPAQFWNPATGRTEKPYSGNMILPHAAFTADGSRLLVVSGDGSAILWSTALRRALARYEFLGGGLDCAVSPDGSLAMVLTSLGRVELFSTSDGSFVRRFDVPASHMRLAASETCLLVCGGTEQVHAFDYEGKLLFSARVGDGPVALVRMARSGKTFMAASGLEFAEFDLAGNPVSRYGRAGDPEAAWIADISADFKKAIVTERATQRPRVLDIVQGGFLSGLNQIPESSQVRFANDDNVLAYSDDAALRLCDATTGELRSKQGLKSPSVLDFPFGMTVSDSGMCGITYTTGLVTLVPLPLARTVLPVRRGAQLSDACMSPDGERVAVMGGGWVTLATSDGSEIARIPCDKNGGRCARFSSDARTLVLACHEGHIQLHDADTGALRSRVKTGAMVHALSLVDSRLDVICGATLQSFNASTGNLERTLETGTDTVSAVFSPAGGLVAIRVDRGIDIWDTRKGTRLVSLSKQQIGNPREFAISSDERLFACNSIGGVIAVVDLASAQVLCRFEQGTMLLEPVALAFAGSSLLLVESGDPAQCRVYDLERRSLARVLSRRAPKSKVIQSVDDGRVLCFFGNDGGFDILDARQLPSTALIAGSTNLSSSEVPTLRQWHSLLTRLLQFASADDIQEELARLGQPIDARTRFHSALRAARLTEAARLCPDGDVAAKLMLAMAWVQRGEARLAAQDVAGALASFERAATSNPKNPFAYWGKGRAYVMLKQPQTAIPELEKALTLWLGDIELELELYDAIIAGGDLDKADAFLHDLIRRFPPARDVRPLWNRGQLALKQGRMDDAVRYLREAALQKPANRPLRRNLARAYCLRARNSPVPGVESERSADDLRRALNHLEYVLSGEGQKALDDIAADADFADICRNPNFDRVRKAALKPRRADAVDTKPDIPVDRDF